MRCTQQRGICLIQGCECRSLTSPSYGDLWAEIERLSAPIPMIIICPNPKCGKQHIDRPDPICGKADIRAPDGNEPCQRSKGHKGVCMCSPMDENRRWTNPDHRSHTCREDGGGCGMVFRLADVLTTGVAEIQTRGKADTFRIDEHKA